MSKESPEVALRFAKEDHAFNAWVDARRDRLAGYYLSPGGAEALRELLRSAFQSGVRCGFELSTLNVRSEEGK